MEQIVECIANFSEGQNSIVIDHIVAAIAEVEGAYVLHRTSDAFHNRSVVTFAGAPDAMIHAAFAAIRTAAEYIDMEQHRGVHPRLGAADVIPFVPIKGITMADCIDYANVLGQRVGQELHLPVYLYEHAAKRPERRNLADVRRGQYEGLKQTILSYESQPDYGPAQISSAGAVIIGARDPLIAFNVFLDTADVTIAESIARKIRFSSGGLPGVKALGLLVKNRAQVSMNIVDYQQSPLPVVVERIRMEAKALHTTIHSSELIGLIPQDAVAAVAAYYLQLHDFDVQRILEDRIVHVVL